MHHLMTKNTLKNLKQKALTTSLAASILLLATPTQAQTMLVKVL